VFNFNNIAERNEVGKGEGLKQAIELKKKKKKVI
jgi:hypothetical protein